MPRGGQICPPPLDFQVVVVFWPLLKIFLTDHLNIGKNTEKQPHIFKNIKIMSIWKSELFQIFLFDRGDQIIKGQEVLGHNYSPTLNKIAKPKGGG